MAQNTRGHAKSAGFSEGRGRERDRGGRVVAEAILVRPGSGRRREIPARLHTGQKISGERRRVRRRRFPEGGFAL